MARKGAVKEKVVEEIVEAQVLSAKELAQILGTDPKTCRRFLRSNSADGRPGQGGRWAIPTSELEAVKTAWEARGTRATEADSTDEIDEVLDEEDIDEIDELAELD